jgi:hypothetical protein
VNLRRKGRTALLNRIDQTLPSELETMQDTVPRQSAPQIGVAVQPSGVFTTILLRTLEERLSDDELQALLHRAGETRTVAEFKETAASTSIDQFTRLRHEANLVLGIGPSRRR